MSCIIPGAIVEVIGEFDSGKTSFALENGYHPNEMVFVDDDVKGKSTVKQMVNDGLEFAGYIDFAERITNKSTWEVYLEMEKVINEVKALAQQKNIKVLIWDTWRRCGESFVEYVRKYPERFVVPNKKGNYWQGDSAIITGNQYKYAALHEAAMLNELQKVVPLIFLVSHTKNNYVNGVRAGVKAASSRALNRVPYFRVWLRRNPDSPIPIALTMKRINKKVFTDSGLRTTSILPDKIIPNIVLPEEDNVNHNDQSLWDTIARYYQYPAGLRKPLPQEIPNEEENAILSGTMTKEQRLSWLVALKQQKLIEQENAMLREIEKKSEATEMRKKGMTVVDIANRLKIPTDVIAGWLLT